MKVVIDGSILRNRHTGVENYTRQLIGCVDAVRPVVLREPRVRHPVFAACRQHVLPRRPAFPGSRWAWALLAPPRLPAADIVHLPTVEAPFLRKPAARLVVTVHDITPLLFPGWHAARPKIYFRLVAVRLLKMADGIICDSRATRDDLVRRLKVPATKIRVVHPGIDPRFRPTRSDPGLPGRYGISGPYLLYVGTLEPRKNVERLLEAYARAKPPEILVVAGAPGWKYAGIHRRVRQLALGNRVVFTGYVAAGDLPGLYSGCRGFLFPSLYEGFGFPVLEAMACGAPVVTSERSSTGEIAADAALTVDPESTPQLAAAIQRLSSDAALRRQLVEKGRRRAAGFTWSECGRRTMAFYRELAGSRP